MPCADGLILVGVYPRARGPQEWSLIHDIVPAGPSPRAGNMILACSTLPSPSAHPGVRGEHTIVEVVTLAWCGTPPRARGTSALWVLAYFVRRTTHIAGFRRRRINGLSAVADSRSQPESLDLRFALADSPVSRFARRREYSSRLLLGSRRLGCFFAVPRVPDHALDRFCELWQIFLDDVLDDVWIDIQVPVRQPVA